MLQGRDGYIFGRGVSDDKGPVLASLFAAKELYDAGKLAIDVVFVIEGEEESGYSLDQRAFPCIISDNLHWFEGCKAIIISNNYWVDNERPCLTYGMRGNPMLRTQHLEHGAFILPGSAEGRTSLNTVQHAA